MTEDDLVELDDDYDGEATDLFDEEDPVEAIEDDTDDPIPDDSGPGIVLTMLAGLKKLLLAPFVKVGSKIPKSSAIADRMILAGYRMKYKLSGADALVHTMYSDRATIPKAGYYDSEEGAYLTKDGDKAVTDGEGHKPYHVHGEVPIQWTLAKGTETLQPLMAFIAHNRERGRYLKHGDEGKLYVSGEMPEDADEIVLDFEKAWEMYFQQIDQEELEEQYDLGYEKGLEGPTRLWLYVLGSFVGGMLAVVALLFAIGQISGGGGGGGTLLGLISLGWP